MSSIKKNSSRIPKDSVAISNNYYELKADGILKDEYLTEEERNKKAKINQLDVREQELQNFEQQLLAFQSNLEKEYEKFEEEKVQFLKRLREEEERMERKKRQDYYEMREFMWDNAINLAQEILNQKIDAKTLSFGELFKGMIKKLPIAFDELVITANPETLEMIKEETNKETWILSNIKWKYDFSLKVGDFIVEEENEFYDYRFSTIFDEIRRKIELKNREIRSEDYNARNE